MAIELIIGIGIAAMLLLIFANSLSGEHVGMKLLAIAFMIILMILLAKGTLDEACQIELVNSTEIAETIGANTTTTIVNQYDRVCFESERNTAAIFYRTILWFFRLFIIYLFVFTAYYFYQKHQRKNG